MKDRRRSCSDRNFKPNNGGVVLSIEFDKRILNEMRDLAEIDGLGSIYQEIRNACYAYAEKRRSETRDGGRNTSGIVEKIGSLLGR